MKLNNNENIITKALIGMSILLLLLSIFFIGITGYDIYQIRSINEELVNINNELESIKESIADTNNQMDNINSDVDLLINSIEKPIDYTSEFDELKEKIKSVEDNVKKINKSAPTVGNPKQADGIIHSNGPLISDGTVSKEYFDQVVYYYQMCPINVRKSFESDGWKIIVTSNTLTCPGVSGRIMAITEFSSKLIKVTTVDPKSVIHEIGHYIDHKTNFCSFSLPQSTYLKELYSFMSIVNPGTDIHNTSSFMEYFAESFYMCIVNGSSLMLNCPETYLFVQQNIDKL